MDPRFDSQGRRRRPDLELGPGISVAAYQWIQRRKSSVQQKYYNFERYANNIAAPKFPYSARCSIPLGHEQSEHTEDAGLLPEFEVTTTNSQLAPGLKEKALLPFRALEETCLPSAIYQRWEVCVAASKSAEWRPWFKTLDLKRQKAHVKRLYLSTKQPFWARLWLDYEELSKPRRARKVAAAFRAMTIIEEEIVRKRGEEAERAFTARAARLEARRYTLKRYGYVSNDSDFDSDMNSDMGGSVDETEPEDEPEAGPLSALLTRHDFHHLRLRLAPCYFRLPTMAVRFAKQIFSGKSYEEAMAEQKANFSSWSRESQVRRVEGLPDHVEWGGRAVHKDAVAKLDAKKKRAQTGEHRRQNKQSET